MMKILYYALSEKIDEGRQLSPLIDLGLRTKTLVALLSSYSFFKEYDLNLCPFKLEISREKKTSTPKSFPLNIFRKCNCSRVV